MIDSMLRTRLITAGLLGPLVILVALLGEPWLTVLVGVVIVLGMIELTALLRAAGYEPPPRLTVGVGLLVAAAGLVAANRSISDGPLADLTRAVGPLGLPTLAMVGATVALALAGFTRADPRNGFATWATTTFGVGYLGLLAPFIVVVGHLAPSGGSPASRVGALDIGSGTAWLLLLIVVVWGYDSGAYLVGRWLGRRRLIAHISPSKTIEGLAGGLLVAMVAAGLGVRGQVGRSLLVEHEAGEARLGQVDAAGAHVERVEGRKTWMKVSLVASGQETARGEVLGIRISEPPELGENT